MITLQVSLSEDAKEFAEGQAAAKGYSSAGEYLGALLRQDQLKEAKKALDAKLRETLASGPAEPMTGEDWDDLERKVWERHRQQSATP